MLPRMTMYGNAIPPGSAVLICVSVMGTYWENDSTLVYALPLTSSTYLIAEMARVSCDLSDGSRTWKSCANCCQPTSIQYRAKFSNWLFHYKIWWLNKVYGMNRYCDRKNIRTYKNYYMSNKSALWLIQLFRQQQYRL